MAKRKFVLPGIHELSKDQERARALPKEGRHLIIGGPGTGKSIIALLRAKRYHADNDYIFLVYNKLLKEASRQLIGNEIHSATWNSWIAKIYRAAMNTSIPMAEETTGWREILWDEVIKQIVSAEKIPPPEHPFLIIDEGQDMPPEFYEALANMSYENFFVVADQNQQIMEENSSLQELKNKLLKDQVDIELKENYRNTYPIARLAREFYTGVDKPPDLPTRPSIEKPLLVEYGDGCRFNFSSIVGHILKRADREPGKLIGVIAPNNKVRERYLQALKEADVRLDNGMPRIETYASGEKSELSFSEGGIVVINCQSCKGLEFDTVFLADIHEYPCSHPYEDAMKRRFYVMVARAKERVVLLREAGRHCPVETILPGDEDILGRWR
ncbi:MAG: ATP-binding domain-containing protein [Pseudomonadota bacterium]